MLVESKSQAFRVMMAYCHPTMSAIWAGKIQMSGGDLMAKAGIFLKLLSSELGVWVGTIWRLGSAGTVNRVSIFLPSRRPQGAQQRCSGEQSWSNINLWKHIASFLPHLLGRSSHKPVQIQEKGNQTLDREFKVTLKNKMENGGYCWNSLWKLESATQQNLVVKKLVLLNKRFWGVMLKHVDEQDPLLVLEEFPRQMQEMEM